MDLVLFCWLENCLLLLFINEMVKKVYTVCSHINLSQSH